MSYHTEGPSFSDPAGEPHIELDSEEQDLEPICQHEHRSVNFSTCYLQCEDCGKNLMDLNGWVELALRVKR